MKLFRLPRLLRRPSLIKEERGVTSIEFAIIAPVFIAFIFATIDLSGYFFSVSQLNAALQVAGRLVRTGQIQGSGVNDTVALGTFRTELCKQITPVFIRNCNTKVIIHSKGFNSFTEVAYPTPAVDGNGDMDQASIDFGTGAPGCPVLISAYYKYETLVPGLERLLAATIPNKKYMSVTMAIRNEPFPLSGSTVGGFSCTASV